MNKTIDLRVITPEREVLHRQVWGISVPTNDGEITVLPGHVALVATLRPGELMIRDAEGEQPFVIGGGVVEVQPTSVVILADTAEHLSELDERRVTEAIARAEQLKQDINQDHVEYAAMAGKLERDIARLKLVRKHRHHGHQGLPYEGTLKQ